MKYVVRIKNDMFGYQRNQILEVEAATEQEAIARGKQIDRFANISIEPHKGNKMTLQEVKAIFERQFDNYTFPNTIESGLTPTVSMTDNALYQFAHAVVRDHLVKQLEGIDGPVST
jgi:hypothetical protein